MGGRFSLASELPTRKTLEITALRAAFAYFVFNIRLFAVRILHPVLNLKSQILNRRLTPRSLPISRGREFRLRFEHPAKIGGVGKAAGGRDFVDRLIV